MTIGGKSPVADRVDTAMDGLESPSGESVTDCPPAEPECDDLRSGYDPVLALRQGTDRAVHINLGPYYGLKCTLDPDAASLKRPALRISARV